MRHPFEDLVPFASVVGGFATGVGVGLGLATIGVGYYQVARNTAVSREHSALEAYRQYLTACFEHPELTSVTMVERYLPSRTTKGLADQMTMESERYFWFLALLLNVGERIVLGLPNSESWRGLVKAQISYHRPVIRELWEGWRISFSKPMQKLVDEELLNADEAPTGSAELTSPTAPAASQVVSNA